MYVINFSFVEDVRLEVRKSEITSELKGFCILYANRQKFGYWEGWMCIMMICCVAILPHLNIVKELLTSLAYISR